MFHSVVGMFVEEPSRVACQAAFPGHRIWSPGGQDCCLAADLPARYQTKHAY